MADSTPANDTPTTPQADGLTPPTATPPAGPAPTDAAPAATIADLPQWAQKEIEDLRKENARRRKATEDAAKKADEDKLAATAQWEQLATQRQAEIDRLAAVAEAHSALSARVAQQIEQEIKAWPAEVKALKPTTDDVATLIAWLETARPLAQKLTQAPPIPGTGATPRPAGTGQAQERQHKKDFERLVRNL